MHYLKSIQKLPISLDDAWNFFSNPNNLKLITPPEMTLIPVSEVPEKMYPGVLFKYKVKPVAGIPLTWVTKITHVQDKQYFIDEQLVGPYSIWHHEHHFKAIKGGVEMTDILWYQVPFGPLGKLVNSIFIKKKVKDIFEYRTKVLIDMFGEI